MITAKNFDFDAIVVGSGITGGWAAKELTEKGLKVLVLERGRDLQHGTGYLGEHAPSWKMPFNGKSDRKVVEEEFPVQSKVYAFRTANRHFWNNDKQNPYAMDEGTPFEWYRGGVVGGRSLMWGRQTYRWSEDDFKANARDGHGIPWPVGYEDIAPWYSYVEKFIGVNGRKEGLPQLPDGEFQKPMPWFAIEETVRDRLKKNAPELTLTNARTAILTEDLPGRSACHYCGPCENGCSTGSYFSSQSSTLPAARATRNLTIRPNSVVERLEYDETGKRISKVHVIDSETLKRHEFSARVVFLCASTIGSAQLLLNSTSAAFPNGLGNSSGMLGRNLMDHFLGLGSVGIFMEHQDSYYYGNRPTGLYIPRFRNLPGQDEDPGFVRGYGYQTMVNTSNWTGSFNQKGFGAGLKDNLRKPPAGWMFVAAGFGECLPNPNNRVYLSKKKDRYGIPQVAFEFSWGENEKAMARDVHAQAKRIMDAAGAAFSMSLGDPETLSVPGSGIHEMGTARMGNDPTQSVVNKYNQAHDVPNLFITDGSFMSSSSCVNPSLTYMAFTARACDYAVKQMQAGTI
ncbi:GMC family oxidoreductase [Pseudomaricurvus sp. HS19]|uniref:GMC family oxidoreductase n=1 Tax=Pseudomaricurvus sp. HS19 TaxID=2692626 RepID=UPI00136A316E|nr:GMC family oxidoreductase [Pseudomaricurvus sp. HS19]MYM62796.1 GMC family oxidoreductase [Pseudomaricurvus sp. HS19]